MQIKGDLRGIDFEDVDSALHLQEGKEVHLKKDLFLKREKGWISLKEKERPSFHYDLEWNGKDPLVIPELGLVFEGRREKRDRSLDLRSDDRTRAVLDFKKLRFPLRVRSRKEGDRYRPCGAPGSQKVKEVMRARRIPPRERDCYPVFLSGEEIVWIFRLPVSESYKVIKDTDEVYRIDVREENIA